MITKHICLFCGKRMKKCKGAMTPAFTIVYECQCRGSLEVWSPPFEDETYYKWIKWTKGPKEEK
jgi:hypothetical protein